MSKSAAAFVSARRVALASALLGCLVVGSAAPAAAWHTVESDAVLPHTGSTTAGTVSVAGAPIDTRDEALAAGGRRAAGPRRRTVIRQGIDVSHWQGFVDWPRVAAAGVDFVIAKATEGTWKVDPWYERNRDRAQKAGILFTAYHYANPSRQRGDAVHEADFFVAHAGLKGSNLIPALDLEESGGLHPAELRQWTLTWLRRVEHRLGVKPMVYTSPGFWTGWLGNTTSVAKAGFDTLWLSHWGTNRPSIPAQRWAGAGWTIWQWTESGRLPGIHGWVDRDTYSGPRLSHMTIGAVRRDNRPATDPGATDPRPRRPRPH